MYPSGTYDINIKKSSDGTSRKIYVNKSRFSFHISNARIVKQKSDYIYVKLNDNVIEQMISDIESYIEKNILSENENILSNIVFHKSHGTLLKIKLDFNKPPKFDKTPLYDINVKAYYLVESKEDHQLTIDIWISNNSDIMLHIEESSSSSSDSDCSSVTSDEDSEDEEVFDDIGPTNEDLEIIKIEYLESLKEHIVNVQNEIDKNTIKLEELKSTYNDLKNSLDLESTLKIIQKLTS
jgi:hypothetical protein